MAQPSQVRTYHPAESAVFLKTNERFGGLSNMAPGFPIVLNGVRIRTSEALYQACRFPRRPDVQRQIIDDPSPMTAKMRSKPFRSDTRPDWDAVRVKIMRWCLRVKLAQNWQTFGKLLLSTADMPIVEKKVRRKDFWGATEQPDGTLVGMNVLGRLLMELREQLKGDEAESLRFIEPLAIPDFLLFGEPIEAVQAPNNAQIPGWAARQSPAPVAAPPPSDPQPSLFEQPMNSETKPAPAHSAADSNRRRGALGRFPQYRDSGLPWLGEIPEHWDVRRNGRLFAERVETGFEDLPILEVSLRTGVRVRDMENGARKQQMADRSKYKRAAKGDVAYNMMRMWQGAVGVAPVDGLISPAYVVARPFPEVDPRYYTYLFRTTAYMREVNKFSRGIVSDRNRLYWDEFKQMPSAFPPTEEQTRIADFLDAHGRLAARLIRNKRRLIGLLNEQKQAIINRAVTRGLNPDAPMKPTGIDWMPEVPAHWEVKRLKTLVRNVTEQTNSLREGETYIALEHVKSWTGEITPPGDDIAFDSQVKRFAANDVLFGKLRPYLAKVTRPEQPGVCVGEFLVLRPTEEAPMAEFLEVKLRSKTIIDIVNSSTFGAKMPRAEWGFIGNLRFAFPPNDKEQAEILASISAETSTLSNAISRTENEITLISEYRERLIADVVTGKLDVRHIEIAAPVDEPIADEDDALDDVLEDGDAEAMEGADADD
ncbi:NADAR domain-containing protein [Sphingopyxis sp. LK2115]|uniref:NADAR domain-containing protein n=1 Tax=Sphingopyxis sp. LK2115 TaxID=2744558 RepID=UPI001CB6E43F|nr:NADAR domain-containing protein [Sphingopyxis sp. LK2115]